MEPMMERYVMRREMRIYHVEENEKVDNEEGDGEKVFNLEEQEACVISEKKRL